MDVRNDPRQDFRRDLGEATANWRREGNGGQTQRAAVYEAPATGAAAAGTGAASDSRGIGDLIKELRDEATTLVRKEVELAKTEIGEKAAKAGRNAAYLAVGGAIAYTGLLFILTAVSFLVTWGLIELGLNRYAAYIVGPLLVGVVVAAIGYGLIQKAITAFKHTEKFVPQKTIDSMQENKQWAQSKI